MTDEQVITIATTYPVKSLNWDGDELVDWAGGGRRFLLDGSVRESRVSLSFPFDAAITSPSRQFAVVYQKLGTKGLVIDRTLRILREINRSFYHAHVYEFPVALFRLPDGREVLAHCPRDYNLIDFDELETGRRLTDRSEDSKAADFFHSRLAVDPLGSRLLSAGWIWHPFDGICLFEIDRALADPSSLDAHGGVMVGSEASSAAFASDSRLIIASATDGDDLRDADEIAAEPSSLASGTIGVLDVKTRQLVSVAKFEDEPGTLMPVGSDAEHVIGFFEHPKLIHVPTGRVLKRWSEIACGRQTSSIIWHQKVPIPPIAMDLANRRFAVAAEKSITVVQLAAAGT